MIEPEIEITNRYVVCPMVVKTAKMCRLYFKVLVQISKGYTFQSFPRKDSSGKTTKPFTCGCYELTYEGKPQNQSSIYKIL